MSKQLRTLAVGAAIAAGLAATPALYAQDDLRVPHGSMMGQGMMGHGGMMGRLMSDMVNMMGMSGDMDGMMEHCNEMMQAMNDGHDHRPNDQWRSPEPEEPGPPRG